MTNIPQKPKKLQLNSNFGNQTPQITASRAGENAGVPSFCFIGMRLVCDECSLPLKLYGENHHDTYTNDAANPLLSLCDICAAEFWGGVK